MLSREENELLTRVGPGTPMGDLMRQYWHPALLSSELPEPDGPPVRVRLLGEDLVAFRDSHGRVGLLGANCPHRGAPLYFGRNEEGGLRCIYHGWKFDTCGRCLEMPNVPDRAPSDVALEAHWQLNVDRPTHSTEQVYRLTPDGRFLGMQETMPLLWLRELVPSPG